MQNRLLKILTFFLLFILSNSLSADNIDYNLIRNKADVLFTQKKYLQAYQKYDSLLTVGGKLSPAMLLKMAYIKEGLGEITQTLYLLNLYQLHFPDIKVFKKMSSLAEKNQLKGYEYNDLEYFIAIYHEFYYQIFYVLVALAIVFFLYNLVRIIMTNHYPKSRMYLMLLIVALVYTFINFGIPSYRGIIINNNCYLMTGPSAGSSCLGTISQGHRVNILNKEDNWYAIIWDNKTAYIKQNNVALVSNSRTKEQFNLFSYLYDIFTRLFKWFDKII